MRRQSGAAHQQTMVFLTKLPNVLHGRCHGPGLLIFADYTMRRMFRKRESCSITSSFTAVYSSS
jgi:hypothetical protein